VSGAEAGRSAPPDAPRIGLGLYPTRAAGEIVDLGVAAETLGYDRVWILDSPLIWRELWVVLGALGARTSRIDLGSAVTSALTRHPAVTASAAATLAEICGGRFALGLGNGDSVAATTGSRPQTLAELRATVETLRGLLAGPGAAAPGGAPHTPRLGWAGAVPVPLYIAASGPRMLELAGELADGVIMMVGIRPAMVRAAIAHVHAGAGRAGRDPAAVRLVLWTACLVSDDSPGAAVEAVKANVARAVLRRLPLAVEGLESTGLAAIRAAYDYARHSDPEAPHARLVPDRLVGDFAIAGATERCARQLACLAGLGLHEIALAVPDAGFDDRAALLARAARAAGLHR
jgi:5,10-methylenetetrahydromethanopterin reductase